MELACSSCKAGMLAQVPPGGVDCAKYRSAEVRLRLPAGRVNLASWWLSIPGRDGRATK